MGVSDQETPLEMTRRHVAEAERRLLRHEMLISRMEMHGQNELLANARALLEQMQDFLRECQGHLDRELAKPQGESARSGAPSGQDSVE